MAEETQTEVSEEEAFGKWLADMQGPDAEEEAEETEEVPAVERLEKQVVALVQERKTDEMYDRFKASASEDAQRILQTLTTKDETPEQLKAKMELAMVKANELAALTAPQAEEQAEKIAKEQYGVGPISGGKAASGEVTPQQYFDQERERVRAGDMHAAFELWNQLPPESEASLE
jgi:hypothetical protein